MRPFFHQRESIPAGSVHTITGVLCLPVETSCFWLPAIDAGRDCLGSPALRPSEFARALEEMTRSLGTRASEDRLEPAAACQQSHCGVQTETGDSDYLGQLVGAQDQARVPPSTYESEAAFHAELLIVAEPSGDLVCADRAGGDRPRRVHFGPGSVSQADALQSGFLKDGSSLRMEILRCSAPHQTLLNERCPHAF
jgi:hypothetical protein